MTDAGFRDSSAPRVIRLVPERGPEARVGRLAHGSRSPPPLLAAAWCVLLLACPGSPKLGARKPVSLASLDRTERERERADSGPAATDADEAFPPASSLPTSADQESHLAKLPITDHTSAAASPRLGRPEADSRIGSRESDRPVTEEGLLFAPLDPTKPDEVDARPSRVSSNRAGRVPDPHEGEPGWRQ